MKVAITDATFADLDLERGILQPLGCEIVSGQCKTRDQLIPLLAEADAVITQFAPIDKDVIGAMTKARVIVRYGIGVDNVDLAAARERQIPVCNVPDYCIDEVADHTLGFMLALTRGIVTNSLPVRQGKWGLAVPLAQMRTLCDQTVGIIGFGRIGRAVAARLAPFRSRRLVYDPIAREQDIRDAGCEPVSLSQLLDEADIVTLHCPSNESTRKMLDQRAFEQMKPGALLINVARGDLVDTAALAQALSSGRLSAAAVDVCDPEPIPADSPLLKLDNLIVHSHIASTSVKAVRRLREAAATLAAMALRGEALPTIVNGVAPRARAAR